tara:strand:- start:3297 stop:3617 length:321 start_codon:yes stop_codon:yes gene_type:complete
MKTSSKPNGKTQFIDVTPTWSGLIYPMLAVLGDPKVDETTRARLTFELERCARIADALPEILEIVLLSPSTVGLKALRDKVRQSLIDSGATITADMDVRFKDLGDV